MKGTSKLVPWYVTNIAGEKLATPTCSEDKVAVLFTDICSFTKLTSRYSSAGHYGVEVITNILQNYFDKMIPCIHNNRGSLVKLGGDSILAFFPGNKQEATLNLKRCSDDMIDSLGDLNAEMEKKYEAGVQFRGGAAYGKVSTIIVGDPKYHFDYYFEGEGLDKALAQEEKAQPGTVNFAFDTGKPTTSADKQTNPVKMLSEQQLERVESRFIADKIRERIKQQTQFKAELKHAAIVFISVEPKQKTTGNETINYRDYHQMYCRVQDIVYSLDGNINKVDVNDKGYMIILTFGVPNIHIDDIERAFFCCYRLSKESFSNITMRSGITYSNIFAGNFGSEERFEFGIIGDGVNAAARLMQTAKSGQITFTDLILKRISSRFESEFVTEAKVKGFDKPLRTYRLVGELPENWQLLENQFAERTLVKSEQHLLDVADKLRNNHIGLVTIAGGAGTGKSFFTYSILKHLWSDEVKIEIKVLEEYSCLSSLGFVFSLISKKLGFDSLEQHLDDLLRWCETNNICVDEELLRTQIKAYTGEESEKDIDGQKVASFDSDKQQSINEIFFSYLQQILTALLADTDILVIDNFHWIDITSGKILAKSLVELKDSSLKSIITIDKTEADKTEEEDTPYQDMLRCFDDNERETIVSRNLNREETKLLILNEFKKQGTETGKDHQTSIRQSALNSLYDITSGNPYFVLELVKILKNTFDFSNNILTAGEINNMQRSGIMPATLETLFLNRFEELDSKARYTLTIASIIGSSFSVNDLIATDREQLKDDIMSVMETLHQGDIVNQRDLDPELEYMFTNTIMRESIYRTVLMTEKRELHRKIARYYEKKYAGNLNNYIEVIANHYIQTDDHEKIVHYCLKAAKKNTLLRFFDDSIFYYQHAVKACSDKPLKLEMELDMIVLQLLQGKMKEAASRFDIVAESLTILASGDYCAPETLKKLQEYLFFVKIKIMMYQSEHQSALKEIDNNISSITDIVFLKELQIYRLDSLRFLKRKEEFLERAEKLYRNALENDDRMQLAMVASLLGQYYLDMCEYGKAREYFNDKIEAAEAAKDQIMVRQALNSIGVTYTREGDQEQAKEYFLEACDIAEKMGDRNGLIRILTNLGTLARNEGDYQAAKDHYSKSLSLIKQTLNKELESVNLYNIGEMIYHESGDSEKALTYFRKSLAIAQDIGDEIQITYCQDAIGDCTFKAGNYEEAEKTYRKNLVLQKKFSDIEGIAHTYGNLGNIAKMRKDYESAMSFYNKQQQILAENGDKDGEGRAWFNKAMIAIETKQYDLAMTRLKTALQLFESCKAEYYIEITKEYIEKLKQEIQKERRN